MSAPTIARRRAAFAIGVVLLAVVGVVGFLRARRTAPTRAAEAQTLTFAFDWPRGNVYRYALSWKMGTRARVLGLGVGDGAKGGDLDGRIDLAGDLVLRSYGKQGDAFLLAARLEQLTRHDLSILGKAALATDESVRSTFEGRDAFLEIDAAGVVRSVSFAKDAPPLFRQLMQSIVQIAQPIVKANGVAGWSVVETTPVGVGNAEYEVLASDPPHVVRVRHPYTAIFALPRRTPGSDEEIHDTSTIRLDRAGHVVALDEREDVTVRTSDGSGKSDFASSMTFAMDLRGITAWDATDAPEIATLDVEHPGDLSSSEATRAQILDQRIAGMTREELERDLFAKALVGSVADKDWLLRASGLLKKHPELCMEMVALFEDRRMNDRGRAQILDLLAGTGTPKAQEAMRAALESHEAHASSAVFSAFVQRFSLVARPTTESVTFVAHAMQDAKDATTKSAATYALGAVAGNAMRAGDRGAGEKYGAVLLAALATSSTSEAKKTQIGALGNLGLDTAVPGIVDFARDPDAGVRGAVAWALRKTDTPEAHEALFALAGDSSSEVEARAFDALAKETLGATDFDALSKMVVAGETQPKADGSLLTLLSSHPEGGEPVAAMLRALLARNDADKPLQAQIRHVLAAMK